MKLNILGTKYWIHTGALDDENVGECDPCAKALTIDVDFLEKQFGAGAREMVKSTKRHEIVHAFLYESGMTGYVESDGSYYHDEEIIDWFAVQAPKIFKAFKQANCL